MMIIKIFDNRTTEKCMTAKQKSIQGKKNLIKNIITKTICIKFCIALNNADLSNIILLLLLQVLYLCGSLPHYY